MDVEIRRLLKMYIFPGQCGEEENITVAGNGLVENNVPGTFSMAGTFWLGMPKGFNFSRYDRFPGNRNINVHLFATMDEYIEEMGPDSKNISVWYLQQGKDLFVKMISPRINRINIAIIARSSYEEYVEKTGNKIPVNVADLTDQID